MDERDHGIILRIRPLTETSLIVQWLGREQGLISTVAKGARRPKSAFMGKLDLFYFAHFTFQRSRRSELHALREVQLDATNEKLRHELGWLNQAAYAGALVEHTSERETPLPGQYDLFLEFLECLSGRPPEVATIFRFELQLLDLLGLAPDVEASQLSGGSRAIIERLCNDPNLAILISPAQSNEIGHFLLHSVGDLPPRLHAMRQSALRSG